MRNLSQRLSSSPADTPTSCSSSAERSTTRFCKSWIKARFLSVPIREITRKLDNDFFAGRWGRATDRQRDLLIVIAHLDNHDLEFTVQEIVEKSQEIDGKPFSPSHVNQMLNALGNAGLVYKNRHGKYSFAVPLLGRFIMRQFEDMQDPQLRLF